MTTVGYSTARGDIVRWTASALLVALAHGSAAYAVLRTAPAEETHETSGAFVLELAPLAVARADVPPELAPGPDQVQAEATPPPVVKTELEQDTPPPLETPQTQAEVTLPAPAPKLEPLPEPPPVPQVAVAATTATQVEATTLASVAAAQAIGAPRARNTTAIPTWQGKLVAVLERNKRYPAAARMSGEQGTTQVAFSLDRQGRLLRSHIVRSSGSSTLDGEALQMLLRAQPFPIPPPELSGAEVSLSVPIRFNFR